jgi:hypothetical protein
MERLGASLQSASVDPESLAFRRGSLNLLETTQSASPGSGASSMSSACIRERAINGCLAGFVATDLAPADQ